jgi:hypothetical protein
MATPFPATASPKSDLSLLTRYGSSFAGAFHDSITPDDYNITKKNNHLIRYLAIPLLRKQDYNKNQIKESLKRGAGLDILITNLLKQEKSALKVLKLPLNDSSALAKNMNDSRGLVVAVYVSRAQVEEVRYRAEGVRDDYMTTLSLAISLDIFKRTRLRGSAGRIDPIYSRLLVGDTVIPSKGSSLSEGKINSNFEKLLIRTFHDLVEEVKREVTILKTSSRNIAGLFQIQGFKTPKSKKIRTKAPEIHQLIQTAATGSISEDEAKDMFQLELQHTFHQFLSKELRKRGVSDFALLPPQSAWIGKSIGTELTSRLSNSKTTFTQIGAKTDIDATGMGLSDATYKGYSIKLFLLKSATLLAKKDSLWETKIFAIKIGGRIFMPRKGDKKPCILPLSIKSNKNKTAMVTGSQEYTNVVGLHRPTTRDIVMHSVRKGSKAIAQSIVNLMEKTVKEKDAADYKFCRI